MYAGSPWRPCPLVSFLPRIARTVGDERCRRGVHDRRLHEVTCPCLVLTGELDGGCSPRLNRFIAETLPDSELIILDGLKHSILIEAPERVAPPVRDFLLRHR